MRKIVRMRLEGKTLREIGNATPNRCAGKPDYNNKTIHKETLSVERTRQLLLLAIEGLERAEEKP